MALTRWMSSRNGVISEYFDAAWGPLHTQGRTIEPGHQFEWAALLLEFATYSRDTRLAPAALRLIEFGETWGVDLPTTRGGEQLFHRWAFRRCGR